ncbi:MAG TPA: hypothetical protein VGD68_09370, partial [Streptosporangiaceae bacterium]
APPPGRTRRAGAAAGDVSGAAGAVEVGAGALGDVLGTRPEAAGREEANEETGEVSAWAGREKRTRTARTPATSSAA